MDNDSLPLKTKGPTKVVRNVAVVTLFTFLCIVSGIIIQMVIASNFGAHGDMDAYLAANTLPQYLNAVVVSMLTFVFLPIFIDYLTDRDEEAWNLASTVINLFLLVFGCIVLVAIFFAEPLIRLTTPGLSLESVRLAAKVAKFTWPTVIASGLISLLTGIYQAQNRFNWPAMVPLIGSMACLGLIVILTHRLGVMGLAIATTSGLILQTALLFTGVLRKAWRYRTVLSFRHPAVRKVVRLLIPLVISGIFIRWTPIIERYLASSLPEGSISHLGYAFRLLTAFSLLISSGISTVIFPKMAFKVTGGDLDGLRHTFSLGLRIMWLALAPMIFIGSTLAFPLVSLIFQRGLFSSTDSLAVAGLLRVYFLAMIGVCLGNITGIVFYALKDTRTLAIIGVIEAIIYVGYTYLLKIYFGIHGIAVGYVIYFNLSFLWQMLFIRYKIQNVGGRLLFSSFWKVSLAALMGAFLAWLSIGLTSHLLIQLLLGSSIGLITYTLLIVLILRLPEVNIIIKLIKEARFAILA